jgi:hypothetical protein
MPRPTQVVSGGSEVRRKGCFRPLAHILHRL